MNTNRGIFESLPSQSANRPDSPFAMVQEPAAEQPAKAPSPFPAAARQESPFTMVDDAAEARTREFGKPMQLPERRKLDSPFEMAELPEGFGFEAPAPAFAGSPFEAAPAAPFPLPAQAVPASPFAAEPQRTAPIPAQAAIPAFTNWQEPAPAAPPAPAFAPAPPAAPVAPRPPAEESQSDSFNIRQLELRAIFGVDREMNADEILQRSRALPGIRNIARVGSSDMATIEALKNLLPSLGFGSGALKLYAGAVPLEFIREGSVMLAVQTDGGFAPGVRETLMIVARELSRIG